LQILWDIHPAILLYSSLIPLQQYSDCFLLRAHTRKLILNIS
jgi:hypothetical protein